MRFGHFYTLFFILCFNLNYAQSTASEQVTKFTIEAPQLDTTKQIWVYLPKNYENSEKRYPVVYMHDAQNLFDRATSYVGEWKVDEYLDNLSDQQSIVIGIEHGNEKRKDELTPYEHETYGGGNGNAYVTFIKNTLKPHIDIVYRTKPEAENTTIFGASLGGLISFYATVKYPDVFGKAGVFSASFWFSEMIYDLAKSTDIPDTSKFYFLIGEKEGDSMVPDQERMVSLLKSKGVKDEQIESHIIKDGEHNEALWSTYFGQAYLWLYND
ncbi:alpha/beta hydrolase [Winogradskyella tangerina]|uniref:alpha/beta hydrolase n=1 Tax=Winogradskyella tangerina TaxID=2023240 RepID=UPI000DBEA3B9|nr:alpha/beta hydrolase-fold protein [Winogradskyella tangerina]